MGKAARGGLEILKTPVVGVLADVDLSGLRNLTGLVKNPQPQRRYPWGSDISPEHANYDDTGINTTSVAGIFPQGASPYGCRDMAGNVWEWCQTKWEDGYTNYHNDNTPDQTSTRVLRGARSTILTGSCAAPTATGTTLASGTATSAFG